MLAEIFAKNSVRPGEGIFLLKFGIGIVHVFHLLYWKCSTNGAGAQVEKGSEGDDNDRIPEGERFSSNVSRRVGREKAQKEAHMGRAQDQEAGETW